MIPLLGWTGFDALVLVCPLVVSFYTVDLFRKRQFAHGTRLTLLLLMLLGIMALQIFNPAQGGLAVGFGGAIFYIVPLLWFYAGHALGPRVLRPLFRVAIGISIAAALYGLYQTFFGLLPVEKEWVRLIGETNYNALMMDDGIVRAFAFFTSAEEYAQFLGIGIVLLFAASLQGYRLALLPVLVLAPALFLESSRGALAMTLIACTVLWAVQGRTLRSWIPRCLLAVVVAVCGLVWSLKSVEHRQFDSQVQTAVQHQAEGLLHPLDAQQSTATTHYGMLVGGLIDGVRRPLGQGLGSTTLAGSKFGNTGSNTEVDLSSLFVSLGCAGGLLYAVILVMIAVMAFRCWYDVRSLEVLQTLGLLTFAFGHWLDGGYYATAMLVWVCIGALHRIQAAAPRQAEIEAAVVQTAIQGAAS